jgi:hypothetical protein
MEARVERVESGPMALPPLLAEARHRGPGRAGRPAKLGLERGDRYLEVRPQTRPGEPLPPGNYTVEIYGSGSGSGAGAVAARKSSVAEG